MGLGGKRTKIREKQTINEDIFFFKNSFLFVFPYQIIDKTDEN
jgi:hypothetical protein